MQLTKLLGAVIFTFVFALNAHATDNCKTVYGNGKDRVVLATGSPGELGLLENLAQAFNSSNDTSMCWQKAGPENYSNSLRKRKSIWCLFMPVLQKKSCDQWLGH